MAPGVSQATRVNERWAVGAAADRRHQLLQQLAVLRIADELMDLCGSPRQQHM